MEPKASLTTLQLANRIGTLADELLNRLDYLHGEIAGTNVPRADGLPTDDRTGLNARLGQVVRTLEYALEVQQSLSAAFFEPGPLSPDVSILNGDVRAQFSPVAR